MKILIVLVLVCLSVPLVFAGAPPSYITSDIVTGLGKWTLVITTKENPSTQPVSWVTPTSPFNGVSFTVATPTYAAKGNNFYDSTFLFTVTSATTGACPFSGTLIFQETNNDGTSSTQQPAINVVLENRDLCAKQEYAQNAAITSLGAFADAAFTTPKSVYLINDVVYIPLSVPQSQLIVSSVTFETIIVTVASNPSSTLYTSNAPTTAGSAVNLQTYPLTSPTGTANIYFSLQLNRQPSSPFASVTSSQTIVFNGGVIIQYKNAKRDMETESTYVPIRAIITIDAGEATLHSTELIAQAEESSASALGVGFGVALAAAAAVAL